MVLVACQSWLFTSLIIVDTDSMSVGHFTLQHSAVETVASNHASDVCVLVLQF